jgi:hypothetical protein
MYQLASLANEQQHATLFIILLPSPNSKIATASLIKMLPKLHNKWL